jgi:glycosyltransferase involved in cell wall biosynthesis
MSRTDAALAFLRRLAPVERLSALAWSGAPPDTVLHFGHTPTLDFYCTRRWQRSRYVDTRILRPAKAREAGLGDLGRVLIVRHAPREWLRFLESTPTEEVALFMDDDLPGILRDQHLPLGYAWRSWWRYSRSLPALRRLRTRWLVSCEPLGGCYGLPPDNVLEPLYVERMGEENGATKADTLPVIFYHGTSSHLREMRWLREVATGVQARLPNAIFEVLGDTRVRDVFRGVPRVRVLNHMEWPDFLEYTSTVLHCVGLAPLLPSPFNERRTHVKFYDITRCGAVGVYSDVSVFRRIVRHGHNGILAGGDKAAWIEAILALMDDSRARKEMRAAALADARAYGRS